MLRGRKDDGTWTYRDRCMALALRAYEDGLCPGCGLHSSVTRGDHNLGRHEVDADEICHGCEALESFQANDKTERFPGQKISLHQRPDWD